VLAAQPRLKDPVYCEFNKIDDGHIIP